MPSVLPPLARTHTRIHSRHDDRQGSAAAQRTRGGSLRPFLGPTLPG